MKRSKVIKGYIIKFTAWSLELFPHKLHNIDIHPTEPKKWKEDFVPIQIHILPPRRAAKRKK